MSDHLTTTDQEGDAPVSDIAIAVPGNRAEQTRSRFTILRLHAQGGLGRVHVARDEQLHRDVALKEIRPERVNQSLVRTRFLTEAEITGQLEHPGIVPIYAIEQDAAGHPVYAMRFIQGRTLAETIADYHRQSSPLGLRDLLQRFISVCQTMAYAHSRGVIHRDLKPANVMVGEYGETLVVDWGLAKRFNLADTPGNRIAGAAGQQTATDTTGETIAFVSNETHPQGDGTPMTSAGQVLGTPAYMPPEQARGEIEQLAPTADIYALGSMLYEILTGRPPYRGPSVQNVLGQLEVGPPPEPKTIGRNIPSPLNAICLKAMAREAANRYATAAELAREVEHWQADEPIIAYREPIVARIGRWARRHKPLVASTLALLFAATVAVTIGFFVVSREKTKTEHALGQVTLKEQETAAALEQVKKREAAERKARQQAIQAFGTLATDVQVRVRDFPQMYELRKDLLDLAVKGLNEIALQVDDASQAANTDFSLNAAYVYMGDISRSLGRIADARQYFNRSREMLERNLAVTSRSPKLRRNLALTYNRIGDLDYYTRNDSIAAAKLYQQTIPLLEAAFAEEKDPEGIPPEHRVEQMTIMRTLLGTRSRFATMNKELNRFPDAVHEYEECLRILERIEVAESGKLPADDLSDRYRLFTLLGETHWQMQDMKTADVYFQQGLKGYRQMSLANPGNLLFKDTLASGLSRYGEFLLRKKDFKGARNVCSEAVELSDEVVAVEPSNKEHQRLLAMSLYRLGVVEDRDGDRTASAKHLRRCLEMREKIAKDEPDHESRQIDLMIALARNGQLDRAVKKAEEIRKGADKKVYALVQIACTYACCAEFLDKNKGTLPSAEHAALRLKYADASVDALETAVTAGLADLFPLETEDDMSGVFDHPRFRALIERHRRKKSEND